MKGFLAVTRREIEEKRFVFLAAAVAGLVPFLAPLVPGLRDSPDEARGLTAFFIACCFAIALSLILGASAIGRDLLDGRLGFYFTRPLRGLSISLGKIVASAALVVGSILIILSPAIIAAGGLGHSENAPPITFFVSVGVLVLALILLAHCCGVAFRSRSSWLVLDAVGLVTTVLLLLPTFAQLSAFQISWKSGDSAILLTLGLLSIAVPALLAASLVQVSSGRTDLRRSHKVMTMTLWSCLVPLAAGAVGASTWYVNPSPSSLKAIASVVAAPDGTWIAVSGLAPNRGLHPAFLYNTSNGSFLRMRTDLTREWGPLVEFSRDGTRAAWLETRVPSDKSPVELATARLGDTASEEQRLILRTSPQFFLAPNGSRLGTISEGLLSVVDLPSLRSVLSLRLPAENEDNWPTAQFVTEDKILLIRRRWSVLSAFKVDLQSKKLTQSVEIRVMGSESTLLTSPNGERLILQETTLGRVTLYDVSSGAALATISTPQYSVIKIAALPDGRFVLADSNDKHGRFRLLSADGRLEVTVDLGKARYVLMGGQPSQEEVLVALPGEAMTPAWKIVSVNLVNGTTRTVQTGSLIPLPYGRPQFSRAGGQASKLWLDTRLRELSELVEFDTLTGQRRVIFGMSASR